jgi:SAM-dependent methyltransferase
MFVSYVSSSMRLPNIGISDPQIATPPETQRTFFARYDTIGAGYASTRREDPRISALIHAALGDARTVVNVGAGAGSYEPRDRDVIAIEPSEVMIAQRDSSLPPAIRSSAYPLPLEDGSVEAAMAILTIHHWDDDQERGVRELRRVARGPVVILTFDREVSERMWLIDYLPEVAELDRRIFPTAEALATWLGGDVRTQAVPIASDTPDWNLGSFWAHPERVLDERARSATSGFARLPPEVVERVVGEVRRDLEDGTWDARHGHLRELDEYDAGLRLVVARPA